MKSRIGVTSNFTAGVCRWAASLTVLMTLAACASAPPAKGGYVLGAGAPAATRATAAPGATPSAAAPRSTPTPRSEAAQPVPTDERTRKFQRAEALYLAGHLKEAAAAFEELTRAYPQDGRIWFRYGNTQAKLGAYDEAAKAFQTALTVDASEAPAALNLALIRLAQAQESLGVAVAGLPAQSPEGLQAQALKGQLDGLVGPPERGNASASH